MAAWHPRNDDVPSFPSSAPSCPHRKRTRAATQIQATYRGGQTRDRVVRTALADFRDICDRISTECFGSAAAVSSSDTLTFRRPTDLPRCFGADALGATSAFSTATATPTASATAATATAAIATLATVTATASTAAAATATSATAIATAATTAGATTAGATAATTATAAVSRSGPPSEGGDENPAAPPAAIATTANNINGNSGLSRPVNPPSAPSARRDPPPQAGGAPDARRAHHGSVDRTETDGRSREERSVDVVVAVEDKEGEEEEQEEQGQEREREGYRSQQDEGFGRSGSGGRGGGGEERGGGGGEERRGEGGGGECLFAYSDDGEENDEELEDSLAAVVSSSTGGDGAAGLPSPLLLPSAASNADEIFVPAPAAAPGHHHYHHHNHHGSGGGSGGEGEQQQQQQRQHRKQQGEVGRGGAIRGDDGRGEVGVFALTPAISSSYREGERERLPRATKGGGVSAASAASVVSGVSGVSSVSDVSDSSSERTSSSPPPPVVAAEGNPIVGGDPYRDDVALAVVEDGVAGRVAGEHASVPETLEMSKTRGKPEAPEEPLGGGDGQDKDEWGGRGRVASGVGRAAAVPAVPAAAAAAVVALSLPSSLSLGGQAVANKNDCLHRRLVSDATTATATATPAAATATPAVAASYGVPSAVLNDSDIYGGGVSGGGGGLWGSREGLRMALSSSFASSCETTPLKGEAISTTAASTTAAATAATTAADATDTAALESDGPDTAEDAIAAAGAVGGGYWRTTPGLDGISHERSSGGGWEAGEHAAGIARRDLMTNWGPLDRDDFGGQASEGRRGPRATTVAAAAAIDDNILLDRKGSASIADASSSELEEELRGIREALANRVRYLQQFRKREEEVAGAMERDPCDVARRLLEGR